jgi:TBCC domain-containing protein 1
LTNCVIVLGPVAGLLVVDRCEHCQIVAPCGGVVVSNTQHTTLFVCTNSPPTVLGGGDCAGLHFAPYNTHYPALEEHLAIAAINPILNCFSMLPSASQAAVLPPEQFASIVVPVGPNANAAQGTTTRCNPSTLPPQYAAVQRQQAERAAAMASSLQGAYKQLEQAGRRDLAEDLRGKVHRAFMDWASASGQLQSVTDLMGNVTPASR